jgi:transcriptional regulator with XRE-family HTH domain
MSQAALGRRLAVGRQQVYRWEAGGREPGSLRLRAIALACGVSADALLGLE